MNVACPDCRSVFRVDPAKVPPGGVRARCAVCGAVLDVAPAAAGRAAPPAAAAAPPTPPIVALPDPEPSPTTEPATSATAAAGVEEPPTDAMGGARTDDPEFAGDGVAAPEGAAPAETRTAAPEPEAEEPPAARAPAAPADAASGARRPFNPYLSNDPNQKARRLARALVSDLVAYHPQRREQGLRDGTLKQLFRDEIRKSWEEYVEQVGSALAESTPHFQDALNDVLAGGRRVF